jgi:hypothetical protein
LHWHCQDAWMLYSFSGHVFAVCPLSN